MAIDKIRPLKIETIIDGSTTDFGPTEANDLDYVSSKGFSFENSDTEVMDLSADSNVQTLSFAAILESKKIVPDDAKNYIISDNHQVLVFESFQVDGVITINATSELVVF